MTVSEVGHESLCRVCVEWRLSVNLQNP